MLFWRLCHSTQCMSATPCLNKTLENPPHQAHDRDRLQPAPAPAPAPHLQQSIETTCSQNQHQHQHRTYSSQKRQAHTHPAPPHLPQPMKTQFGVMSMQMTHFLICCSFLRSSLMTACTNPIQHEGYTSLCWIRDVHCSQHQRWGKTHLKSRSCSDLGYPPLCCVWC